MRQRVLNFNLAFCLLLLSFQIYAQSKPLELYPSLEEFYLEIEQLAKDYPSMVKLEIIGQSVEQRPIYLLRITSSSKPAPKALITGGIHACEFIGARLAMQVAHLLVEQDNPEIIELISKIEIDIVPLLNPDGYYRVYAHNGRGGKIGTRKNANGVDLNRNFPVVPGAKSYHPLAGNRRPNSNYYMGKEELSEPETRAISQLVKKEKFFIAFNLHSVAGKFLYPYAYSKKPAPDIEFFKAVGEAFSQAQKNYLYKVEQSYNWYPTLGDMDDYLYLWFGIPSFTVEVGTVKSNLFDQGFKKIKLFWFANPKDKYEFWLENDSYALIFAIKKAEEISSSKPIASSQLGGKDE